MAGVAGNPVDFRAEGAVKAWACTALLVLAIGAQALCAPAAGPVRVTFYHTSDMHEHAAPLGRIARFVEERRKTGNVVFLDTGDWFDKGDLTRLGTRGEAMVALLAACRYDALIPGNHDYGHGADRLAELISKYSLPVVMANAGWPKGTAAPATVAPHRLFRFKGVRVAVIGVATPNMRNASGARLSVRPVRAAVAAAVGRLRKEADVVVVMTHQGVGADKRLARAVPGIDIIFGGHHHRDFKALRRDEKSGTILQHSGSNGKRIGELVIEWDGKTIVNPRARLLDVTKDMSSSERVDALWRSFVLGKTSAGAGVEGKQ